MTLIALSITLVLVSIIFWNKRSETLGSKPGWLDLVNELKSVSPAIRSREQLEQYLSGINEQVKNYETDYSFLVAFNSTIREIKDELKT